LPTKPDFLHALVASFLFKTIALFFIQKKPGAGFYRAKKNKKSETVTNISLQSVRVIARQVVIRKILKVFYH
jgi:hypothetical protein